MARTDRVHCHSTWREVAPEKLCGRWRTICRDFARISTALYFQWVLSLLWNGVIYTLQLNGMNWSTNLGVEERLFIKRLLYFSYYLNIQKLTIFITIKTTLFCTFNEPDSIQYFLTFNCYIILLLNQFKLDSKLYYLIVKLIFGY